MILSRVEQPIPNLREHKIPFETRPNKWSCSTKPTNTGKILKNFRVPSCLLVICMRISLWNRRWNLLSECPEFVLQVFVLNVCHSASPRHLGCYIGLPASALVNRIHLFVQWSGHSSTLFCHFCFKTFVEAQFVHAFIIRSDFHTLICYLVKLPIYWREHILNLSAGIHLIHLYVILSPLLLLSMK